MPTRVLTTAVSARFGVGERPPGFAELRADQSEQRSLDQTQPQMAWAVTSEGASAALEALAIMRITGERRGREDAGYLLDLVEEHQRLWDAWATTDRERRATDAESEHVCRIGGVLLMLGAVAFGQGDLRRARSAQEEALALFRKLGDRRWEGLSLWYLAMFDATEQKWTDAACTYRESLLAFIDANELSLVHKPLIGLASIASETEQPSVAAWLLGSAEEQLRRSNGHVAQFGLPAHTRAETLGRRALGDVDFMTVRWRGRNFGSAEWPRIADVVVRAANKLSSRSQKAAGFPGGVLTAREQDVLRLMVEGRSNPEIADELFVGVGTAKTHVAHILAKLGVPTRAAAATHAVRLGLI